MKVPLIDPHKLFGMGDGAMLASLAGLDDIVPAYAPGYWEIAQCRERVRANPYHEAPGWEESEPGALLPSHQVIGLPAPSRMRSFLGRLFRRRQGKAYAMR